MKKKLKEMVEYMWIRIRIGFQAFLMKKDRGESHVITVIAMCVIGVALVLILSTALKPVIITLCSSLEEKITSMFQGL